MRCDFIPTSEPDERGWQAWKCSRQGCTNRTTAVPPGKITARCKIPGLGDYVAYYIAWFTGITKDDMKKWFGGCPCARNQERLNTLPDRLRAWWRS